MSEQEISDHLKTLEAFFEKNYKIPYFATRQHLNIREILIKLENYHTDNIIENDNLVKYNQFMENFRKAHSEDVMKFIKIIQYKDKINQIILSNPNKIRMLFYDDNGIYNHKEKSYYYQEYFSENLHFYVDSFEYKNRKNGKFVFFIKLNFDKRYLPLLNKKDNTLSDDIFFKILTDGVDTLKDNKLDVFDNSRLNKTYLKDLKEKYHQKTGYQEVRLKSIYIPIHYENIKDFSVCDFSSPSSYFLTAPFRNYLIEIVDSIKE